MNANITKVKLKDDYFLEVEYSEMVGDNSRNVKEDRTAPVHDDLRRLFRQLHPHMGMICEQVKDHPDGVRADHDVENEKRKLTDPENLYSFFLPAWHILDNISCTGFNIGGNGDTEGVTLIGRRELSTGKTLNLVSPLTKWEGDYDYAGELSEIIEQLKGEVMLYLFEGKKQPDTQLSLFDEEEGEENDQSPEGSGVTVSFNGGPEVPLGQFEAATKTAIGKKGKQSKAEETEF